MRQSDPKPRQHRTQGAPAGAALRLDLFGRFSVHAPGGEIEIANRKCRALLGYLALSDAAEEPRERVIGLLWSETDEEHARASLRQAIYELRTALEPVAPKLVSATKVALALDRNALAVDIWSVLADAKEGHAHSLLLETERLTDSLLADLETIDPAFRTWLVARRQTLHDRLLRPLEQALRAGAPRDERAGTAKADIARALVNLEPTHEEAARALMRLRADAGDIAGALAIYRRLWDLLGEEFDVEPSRETQDLVVGLKLAQPSASQAPPPHAEASTGSIGAAEIAGPATLAVFARGVSEEQALALEKLMAARPDASYQPLSEENQRAWLVETPSAPAAAKLAFQIQSACRAMPDGGPLLLMGAHASAMHATTGTGLNRLLADVARPGQLVATEEFRERLTDGVDATVHDLGFVQPPRANDSVRAFTVTPPGDPSGLHLPEAARLRPAIAVLPFELRAANDDAATLGELLADEIITALSGTRELDVISRLSTRAMARQRFGLCEIWSHLQSDYVLAGRPRSRLHGTEIVIELTDVRSKSLKWSQARVVGAQSSGEARALAEAIAAEVMAAILISESERSTTAPLASLQSYTLLFAAITLMDRWTRAGFERSHELLVELRDRAPLHPLPNAWLSAWHTRSISQGWTNDRVADGRAAVDFAQRSLDADPHYSLALAMDAYANIHVYKRFDIAVDRLSLALESNPNDSLAWLLKGVAHTFRSEGATAVDSTDRALRLSPLDPRRSYYETMAAGAELMAGNYARAIDLATRSLRANRLHASPLRCLAVAQQLSGDGAGAQKTIARLLEQEPGFTISGYLRGHPAGDMELGRFVADALRSAGAPP
jgi:DNA-binding SARP family transcriptional activator/TolB-like protein